MCISLKPVVAVWGKVSNEPIPYAKFLKACPSLSHYERISPRSTEGVSTTTTQIRRISFSIRYGVEYVGGQHFIC